jgi:pimeloyl-ACP methyl ester carboxylesterase
LAALIHWLNLERPVVAGHSMGAGMAAQLGARYPNLPRALILEDPPWRAARPSKSRDSGLRQDSPHAAWMKSLAGLSLEQLIERQHAEHPT